MRRWLSFSIVMCALAVTLVGTTGCGEKEEAPVLDVTQIPRLLAGEKPSYYPKPSTFGGLKQGTIDTKWYAKKYCT